jgi:hypothetical protein
MRLPSNGWSGNLTRRGWQASPPLKGSGVSPERQPRRRATSSAASAEAAREHWKIENALHWVLDVTLNEDQSRIRKDHAPEDLALLCRLALNLIRKAKPPKASVRGSVKKAGWDNSFLEKIPVA